MDCRQYSYVFLFNNYQNNVFITIIIYRRKKGIVTIVTRYHPSTRPSKYFSKYLQPSPAEVDWFTYPRISGLGSFRAFSCDSFNISIHPYNQVHDKKNLHHQKKEKEALSVCHELHAVVTCYGNGKWTKASIMNYWLQIQRPENILWQTWIIQPVKISSLIVVVQ